MPPLTDPVLEQIAALRRELGLTWSAHEREHTQHEQAHAREHAFAQKAIDTAAELAKENKADANEWRDAMNDREDKFATKEDAKAILERLDKIERAGLVAAERERQRAADEAEAKRLAEIATTKREKEAEERANRGQRNVAIVVGVISTVGGILISLVLRLAFPS